MLDKKAERKLRAEFGFENICPYLCGFEGDVVTEFILDKTGEMVDLVRSYIGKDNKLAAELSILIPHLIEDGMPDAYLKNGADALRRMWSEASSIWLLLGDMEDGSFPTMYDRVKFEEVYHRYQRSEAVFWDALLHLAKDDDKLFHDTMSDLNMRISSLYRAFCIPLGDVVVVKLNALMEREGESEEWRRTLSVNSVCPEVLDYKYDYYLGKGNAREAGLALRVIRDNQPSQNGSSVPEIEKQLLALFEEAGMVEDVKRQLQHIFLCYEQEDLSYYLRYRELATEDEFNFVRSRLDGVQTYGLMEQVLIYEEKYEELFSYMERYGSLETARRCASVLASYDLERFCTFCEKRIDRAIAGARGNDEYCFIAEMLDIMKMVEPGRAQQKAEEVIKGNSRKRNLKQMILARGFTMPRAD